MAGPEEITKTKEKQAEPIAVQKAETLREHLSSLHQWNVPAGQTLEEARRAFGEQEEQRGIAITQRLRANAQQQLPPANAAAAAPGAPVQQQAPAKKSYKQRRKEEKHAKYARKQNPVADSTSYDMVESLQILKQLQLSSATPEQLARVKDAGGDTRIARIFCTGYWKDKKGNPLDDNQRRFRDQDLDWLDAYAAHDLQRMTPHLNRFVNEILSYKITPDMLTAESLRRNAADVKLMNDRMTYIENLQRDPVTAPFFQQLDPIKLAMLNNFTNQMTGPMGMALVMNCAARGVSVNHADYDRTGTVTTAAGARSYQDNADGCIAMIDGVNQQIQQANDAAADAEIERQLPEVLDMLHDQSDLLRSDVETGRQERDVNRTGLDLTGYVTEYSFDLVAEMRTMIESHPAEYAQHHEIVDKIYGQFHHTADAMGDVTLLTRAYQYLQDGYPPVGTADQTVMRRAAERKLAAAEEKLKPYTLLLAGYKSALKFLLAGDSLGRYVRDLLLQMGMQDADLPPAVD